MMGPGLGGGFGKYQGYFGLVLDNIISMNVVLADGSMSTVSASSMPDLYWGMRGAGHNFGIVTSFNHKIYNEPVINWFVETMIFTADKLEAFWENMNALGANGTQPVGLVTYAIYAMNPEISKTAVGVLDIPLR
jgi:FAD/FMN-containing dehydrogenase